MLKETIIDAPLTRKIKQKSEFCQSDDPNRFATVQFLTELENDLAQLKYLDKNGVVGAFEREQHRSKIKKYIEQVKGH